MRDIQIVIVLSDKAQPRLSKPDFETITDVIRKTLAKYFEEHSLSQAKNIHINFAFLFSQHKDVYDISLSYIDRVTAEKHLGEIKTNLEVLMQSFGATLTSFSGLSTEVLVNEGCIFQIFSEPQKPLE